MGNLQPSDRTLRRQNAELRNAAGEPDLNLLSRNGIHRISGVYDRGLLKEVMGKRPSGNSACLEVFSASSTRCNELVWIETAEGQKVYPFHKESLLGGCSIMETLARIHQRALWAREHRRNKNKENTD